MTVGFAYTGKCPYCEKTCSYATGSWPAYGKGPNLDGIINTGNGTQYFYNGNTIEIKPRIEVPLITFPDIYFWHQCDGPNLSCKECGHHKSPNVYPMVAKVVIRNGVVEIGEAVKALREQVEEIA